MSTILERIFEVKRTRVDTAKRATDLSRFAAAAREARENAVPHRFRRSIETLGRVNVIAEFKRASPSKGIINGNADPPGVARAYEAAGAAAISVLTEEDHFRGSLDDLRAVRQTVELPILRKDFIFDEYQIYESAISGADAILLIAASLYVDEIRRFRSIAEGELGMDALVEVHTKEEMEVAKRCGASLIGVNNRDLKTFDVSLDVSRELVLVAPAGTTLVAESGLRTRQDIDQLLQVGYTAFLIGETLMRSDDVESALRDLLETESVRG